MGLKLVKAALSLPMDDPSAKLLLVAMAYVSEKGEVWANKETLMALTSLNKWSYYKKIKILTDKKLVERKGNFHEHRFDLCIGKEYSIALEDDPKTLEDDPKTLEDNPKTLENSPRTLEDNPNPYIGTELNGSITEFNLIISKKEFLEGADIGAIPREWASDWYDQCQEEGWFFNRSGEPKPYAQKHGLMVRKCLRYYNQHGRNMVKNGEKKSLDSQPEHIVTMTANTRLREILKKKENHPGDPAAYKVLPSDHPSRKEWWDLCNEEKQIREKI